MVRNYILTLTPIGTSSDDVVEYIMSRDDWGNPIGGQFQGGVVYRGTPIPGWPLTPGGHSIVGAYSLRAHIGSYRSLQTLFIELSVHVDWAFDADGLLIDVFVGSGMML